MYLFSGFAYRQITEDLSTRFLWYENYVECFFKIIGDAFRTDLQIYRFRKDIAASIGLKGRSKKEMEQPID